jgi:hypothetical protein
VDFSLQERLKRNRKPFFLHNKKGSTMVEAALIYPMIIAAIMAVIFILISMYSATAVKANIHTTLRAEVFSRTKTGESIKFENSFYPSDKYSRGAFNQKVSLYIEKNIRSTIIYGQTAHQYNGNALLHGVNKYQSGRMYVIDEKDYIRKASVMRL